MSEAECNALLYIIRERAVLITQIAAQKSRDFLGEMIPGMRVFKKLAKQGLVLITEEEPDEDGFTWTPMIEITDAGLAMAKTL